MPSWKQFIACASTIACIGALTCVMVLIIEQDTRVVQYLGSLVIESLSTALHHPVSGIPDSIRVYQGRITLAHVAAEDPNAAWKWSASRLHVHIHWRESLRARQLRGSISFENLSIQSTMNESYVPAIAQHLEPLFMEPVPSMLEIKTVRIPNGTIELTFKDWSMHTHIRAELPLNTSQQLTVSLRGASLYNNRDAIPYITHGSGKIATLWETRTCFISLLWQDAIIDERIALQGDIRSGSGSLLLTAANPTLKATCTLDIPHDTIHVQGVTPVATAHAYLPSTLTQWIPEKGVCHWEGRGTFHQMGKDMKWSLMLKDALWKGVPLPLLEASIQNVTTKPKISTRIHILPECMVQGEGELTENNAIRFSLHGAYKQISGTVNGTYTLNTPAHQTTWNVLGEVSGKKIKGAGSATCNKTAIRMAGTIGNYQGSIHAQHEQFKKWCITATLHQKKQKIAECTVDLSQQSYTGFITYATLQDLIHSLGEYSIPSAKNGACPLLYEGTWRNDTITTQLKLLEANIRIPHTYAVIKEIQCGGTYEYRTGMFEGSPMHIQLQQGSIVSKSIRCSIDTHKATVRFAHIPLTLHACFLSYAHDIFAQISGVGVLQYHSDKTPAWQGNGALVIDTAHIQANILSQEFQSHFYGPSFTTNTEGIGSLIEGSLLLLTNQPVKVKAPFLEASAAIQLLCKHQEKNVSVSGSIDITNGTLLFPYKPLFIQHCRLTIQPNSPQDPLIELIAENTIKRYLIRLIVDGSIKNPHISFQASPELEEEKIIGLLLGGSEQGSLYLAMSSSVMHAIEQLLFGPAHGSSKLRQWLSSLFSPLGSVRLVPGFSDQTGRGGIRGTLAVEVNDRLRGLVKHNFDLPQDTLLEVEYAVSDDITIRGFKDERGDLGAEVEGQWKL